MKTMLKTIMHEGQPCYALMFNCPGCEEFGYSGIHLIPIKYMPKDGGYHYWDPGHNTDFWYWDGDHHHPTLRPSLVVKFEEGQKCHAVLDNGVFRYLNDSTHSYSGMSVELGDIPEEYL